MTWTIEYTATALGQLRKLDRAAARRIVDWLEARVRAEGADPRQQGKQLSGPLGGLWRYRVGDYRVICELQQARLVVLVVRLGHRREIYR